MRRRGSPRAVDSRGSFRRYVWLPTLAYLIFAVLYIAFSSWLVAHVTSWEPKAMARWELIKGWTYVGATAVALFLLLQGAYRRTQELEQAKHQAQELGEQFRTLVELAPDAILIHQDGIIRLANYRAAGMWGAKAPEDLVGRPALDLVAPSFREKVRERIRQALEQWGPLPLVVEEFLRLDGTTFRGEVAAAPVHYQGRPAMKVVIRDVTERELTEAALREAHKLQAVGMLASSVAHEFNNLLQATSALLFQLRQRFTSEIGVEEELRLLEDLVDRGAAVTRQLLLFSRQHITQVKPLDLNKLAEAMAHLLRRLLPENLIFRIELAPEPLVVVADPHQLEQVILNLVMNARDATPSGGVISLTTSGDAQTVRLSVADTGSGIPEEIRSRIFEPFFTTKAPEKGTGLGLAVVKDVVTQLGGQVELLTEVGKGTTFQVVLPRAVGQEEATAAQAAPPHFQVPPGTKVLLVEDNDIARASLAQVLQSLGLEVTTVAGAGAAEALPREPAFDVLLTDYLLPEGSGRELAEKLVQRWPEMAVVIMSGYAKEEVLRENEAAVPMRFLQKPFSVDELVRELAQVTGKSVKVSPGVSHGAFG
ncbi:MAG: ATP-binding protein [Thermoanaerobaculaceae bacterium]